MTALTNAPIHTSARWTRLRAYRTTVANPPKFPKLVLLRSSCGHVLGVGYVYKRQGYLSWKACR